ncbi:MAG: glycosyltransferase [Bacteroidaceae bacterium]|nr:glycosyltransferase [Bacteroidaceae bacterium]
MLSQAGLSKETSSFQWDACSPLVSVVTITYNHAPYIAKCIEGVVMQQVDFPMEFIIAEDCSTDGTRAICEEYAAKYPDLIRLITSERNVGYNPNELRAMRAARGKYIAYCEGDDYWTEPQKLQRQVDFLESHPDYSVCFHRCHHLDVETGEMKEDNSGSLFINGEESMDVSLDMFFGKWITQPLTMVFRTEAYDLSLYNKYKYYRDMHQIYHLMKKGKCRLFAFDGGLRIIHNGGMASKLSVAQQCVNGVNIAKELYKKNKDKATKAYYEEMLQWYLYNIGTIQTGRLVNSFRLFYLTRDLKMLGRNLKRKY